MEFVLGMILGAVMGYFGPMWYMSYFYPKPDSEDEEETADEE